MSQVWVTLHRIAPDSSAPLDSMRAGAAGQYAFRYTTFGDSTAVYLVAGNFGGIVYFADPLTQRTVSGVAADLIVYDTASHGVLVTVESRHVVVSAPNEAGQRRVVEVFMLANATDRTRVASATVPTFRATLPDGATDPRVAEGAIDSDAMTFAGGRVEATAPVAPGTKRIAYSYQLAVSPAPFGISASDSTAMLEILVEDSAATVSGDVVHEEAPAALSGRTFRRYTGQFVASTAALRIVAPSGSDASIGAVGAVVLVIALGMAVVFVMALRRRSKSGALPFGEASGDSVRLAPSDGAA